MTNVNQQELFQRQNWIKPDQRLYHDALTVAVNHKGVIDVDTVKGCTLGMRAYPDGGCYGECYARKIAFRYGINFNVSISRKFVDWREHRDLCIRQLISQTMTWYNVGVAGDPSHDWNNTISIITCLHYAHKTAVIITKHWIGLSDEQISRLTELDVVIHTSTSGMDSDEEIKHRVIQIKRLRRYGIHSINRVVTCDYGNSTWAVCCKEKQDYLLSLEPVVDNPFRVSLNNLHVLSGEIKVIRRNDSIGGTLISMHSRSTYIGHCKLCPEQCYVQNKTGEQMKEQLTFPEFEITKTIKVDTGFQFRYVKSVIGSGYESAVAEMALEDGIAHRAARKNMQIHSAIILLHGGEFAGFFTFQNNHDIGEFCLLQSVIRPDLYNPELYQEMARQVVEQNTANYPMLMTTNPKSKFETPEVFENLGFKTYLKMSGFHYMLAGNDSVFRMKILAHITMTNVWDSVKGKWLELKKIWNEHIDLAGIKYNIANPRFATREGCWQGESGFSNVVTGRSHNGNASVLDPVACEVILRFFTPRDGKRIYNPFGGGVQFGYVAGASGYKYLASEIRQNQCDANNALCGEFKNVRWVCADSSTYEPMEMFDLIFACPPYYKVEKYTDYDGKIPDGEINALPTYEIFRNTLFAGYRKAIDHLNDNRFFVVMTGDSRNNNGAYYCHEAETELFLRDQGLSIYNRIVYLESEFTRLAQAKKTLNMRKFPKREQKIIIAYKGNIKAIKDIFAPIGRL